MWHVVADWLIRGSALGPISGLSARQSNSCLSCIEEKKENRVAQIWEFFEYSLLTVYRRIKTAEQQYGDQYFGRSPPRPLLAVPNVTAHPSTASVPTTLIFDVAL